MKLPILPLVLTLALSASSAQAQTSDVRPQDPGGIRSEPAASSAPSGVERAQDVPAGLGDALKTIAQDFAAFPSARTLTWIGAGAGLAAIGGTSDHALGRNLGGTRYPLFGAGARMGGGSAHAGLALGTFAVGKLSGSREVSALGYQLIRANVMTQAITQGLKYTTQRIRPDGTTLSFPSGHSATSFAAATVLQRRYGWKAGVPAYAVASYIAASRVNDRRHYASDVIFGAGLGIAVGLTVTRDHPRAGSFMPVVTRGGVSAVWTKTW